MRTFSSRCIAWLLPALLSACAVPHPPAPPPTGSPAFCLAQLSRDGIGFEIAAQPVAANGCGIANAVRIRQTSLAWSEPALMSCGLAERFDVFETEILQPAALRYFHRPVAALDQIGTFSCRRESSGRDRLSQHALGNAIDIHGFQLRDGSHVSVSGDWHDGGAKGAFLHEVALGACRYFNVVLTPESNAAHRDHLHFDVGPYKLCGLKR